MIKTISKAEKQISDLDQLQGDKVVPKQSKKAKFLHSGTKLVELKKAEDNV